MRLGAGGMAAKLPENTLALCGGGFISDRLGPERFQAKWIPVRRPETRQTEKV
jgi:hypothetical protein